ncbi:hypothetical protein AGMMS50296_2990 [Alphaproteobacteria bacterium]|nr:hypothetical protein AGMMS50296_2990 [Alphaproteobacteria bacterium]
MATAEGNNLERSKKMKNLVKSLLLSSFIVSGTYANPDGVVINRDRVIAAIEGSNVTCFH